MRTISIPLILLFTLLMTACSQEPADNQTASALESTLGAISQQSSKGAELTRRKCGSCHSLDRNIRKVGPSLKGIFGKAPSISGIPFAAWNEETLEKWLTSPRSVKKNTRMSIPGISDPAERKAIIDYLKLI